MVVAVLWESLSQGPLRWLRRSSLFLFCTGQLPIRGLSYLVDLQWVSSGNWTATIKFWRPGSAELSYAHPTSCFTRWTRARNHCHPRPSGSISVQHGPRPNQSRQTLFFLDFVPTCLNSINNSLFFYSFPFLSHFLFLFFFSLLEPAGGAGYRWWRSERRGVDPRYTGVASIGFGGRP